MSYQDFIDTKSITALEAGFTPDESVYPEAMFPQQQVTVTWACKRGRAGQKIIFPAFINPLKNTIL